MKLELEIYFDTPKDIGSKIYEIKEMIKTGIMDYQTTNVKYRVLMTQEPKCRFEEIDGKACIIFESKMNKDG